MDAALRRAERMIAHQNIRFILAHQNDTLEQLTAYLSACTDALGHAPAKCEVIGGDYIEYRFDSWVNALRSFFHGKITTAKDPPPFAERQIVKDALAALEVQP